MEGMSPDHSIIVGEDADRQEGWTTNVEGSCSIIRGS